MSTLRIQQECATLTTGSHLDSCLIPPSPKSQVSSLSTPAPASRGCKQSHLGLSGQTDQPLFGQNLRPIRRHVACKPTRLHRCHDKQKACRRPYITALHCAMPSSACTGKQFYPEIEKILCTWHKASRFNRMCREDTASRNGVRVAVVARITIHSEHYELSPVPRNR